MDLTLQDNAFLKNMFGCFVCMYVGAQGRSEEDFRSGE